MGNQFAQPEKDVLVPGQTLQPGQFEQLGQAMHAITHDIGAHLIVLFMKVLHLASLIVVKPAVGFEMNLPPVATDRHLHDFRSSFINSRDPHVALDFFHHVFVGIAVASQSLNGSVGGEISRLGGQILRNSSFGIQVPFLAIDAFGCLFDIGAPRFQ